MFREASNAVDGRPGVNFPSEVLLRFIGRVRHGTFPPSAGLAELADKLPYLLGHPRRFGGINTAVSEYVKTCCGCCTGAKVYRIRPRNLPCHINTGKRRIL